METRVMVVGSVKAENGLKKNKPRIRLTGPWLAEMGFQTDCLATAEYQFRQITIRLQGSGLEAYSKVVKKALSSREGLLQVRQERLRDKRHPHLQLAGFWLEDLGFKIGSLLVIRYEYGLINLQLLDLDELKERGFFG